MHGSVALLKNVSSGEITRLEPPSIVRCEAVGEPHWANGFGHTLNIYTHRKCPEHLAKAWRERWAPYGKEAVANFEKNNLRNYLVHLGNPKEATLLSYLTRPEEAYSAKNFLFFRTGQQRYVEALFSPHTVYALDARTGLMNASWRTRFDYHAKSYNASTVGLSAGPVWLDKHTFLSAAHVSRGGWEDAYRMTFFYLFDSRPPFQIRCATPPMSFGYSDTLEYCTSLELLGKDLLVGFGYHNCFSALVKVRVADVVARCTPTRGV